jgi:hypothetical protein
LHGVGVDNPYTPWAGAMALGTIVFLLCSCPEVQS